jgi:hypothetical protein
MRLRVFHIPQIPGPSFIREVASKAEGELLLDVLADYDAFEFENRIKPDYANVGGIEYFDDDEGSWLSFHDDELEEEES